jgi:glycosyltransferase involved in cell wall biosynthesis
MSETTIVIPCYDEAGRLPVDAFTDFVQKSEDVDFIFVNDGSRDDTLSLLRNLETRVPGRFSVLDQQPNRGKAEAVRLGMNAAFERGARHVGYFDADLATPLSEVARMVDVLDSREQIEMVFGARVQLLGRRIERHRWRHYLGRVFATVASETLGLQVYDTQCGAKLFRVTPTTRRLFAEPFEAGWIFDVEIIARRIALGRTSVLTPVADAIHELPLDVWVDVAGSKVRAWDYVRAAFEMARVYRRYLAPSAPSFGAE